MGQGRDRGARVVTLVVHPELRYQWVVVRRELGSRLDPRVATRVRRPGDLGEQTRVRPIVAGRILRIDAGFDRMTPRPWRRRPGSRTIHSTRSTPHTISVTGCSTWRRALTSRNESSSVSASTR